MSSSVYFNARAKALEKYLLTEKQLFLIIDSTDLKDIVSILSDSKLLKKQKIQSLTELISLINEQQKEFFEFLNQTTPNEFYAKYFTLKYDFINLQSMYIQKRLKIKLFEPQEITGQYSLDIFEKCIESRNYNLLTSGMAKCLNALENSKNLSGFYIDTAFKKAYYLDLYELSKSSIHLSKITEFLINATNIILALKVRNIELFNTLKLENGTLSDIFLNIMNTEPLDTINEKIKLMPYAPLVSRAIEDLKTNSSLTSFEQMVESYPVRYFDDYRLDTNQDIPYLKYCFQKMLEIKNLRIIFQGLKHGEDKNIIKNQIRRNYVR